MGGKKVSAEQKSATASDTMSQFVVVRGIRLEITRKITRPFPISAKVVKDQPKYQNHMMLDMMKIWICDETSGVVFTWAVRGIGASPLFEITTDCQLLILRSEKMPTTQFRESLIRAAARRTQSQTVCGKFSIMSQLSFLLTQAISSLYLAALTLKQSTRTQATGTVSWYRFVWVQQWRTREDVKR